MRIGSGVLGLVFLTFFLEAGRVRDADSAGSRLPMNVGKNGSDVKLNGETPFQCDYLGQEKPGKTPRLFAPGVISTGREHSSVLFSPDGREIWFGRLSPPGIWTMARENGKWSEPKPAPLDQRYAYLYPFLSPDGNRLFFTSDRPVKPGDKKRNRGVGDLWAITRNGGIWSEPAHLGEKINFGTIQSLGSVSLKGNLYYAVRTGTAPRPSMSIYSAELVNGAYSDPRSMDALYSDAPSHSPFIAPDENYILFSSFRGGSGASDIFISFRTPEGRWTRPQNLGPRINSPAKDEYPYVTPDGKFLFFNSNRVSAINDHVIPDGPGNIFWVDAAIIEERRPREKQE
jgi:hypothetical protein